MKLSEMCEIKMGQSPESSTYNEEGKGLPFFQGNADFGKIHPSVRVWCSSPVKIALPNDILISVRAPIGALNIADTKCCIGRGLAALTVNESVCNARYLWYALQSKVSELNAKGTGSTFKAINKAALADTEIPYVPLDKQKKIADIFDKLSFAIDKRDRQIEILNLLVKSRFVEMFGDANKNPHNYIVKSLQWLIENGYITYHLDGNHGGNYPKNEEFVENGVPYIGANCISNGEVDFSLAKHLTEERASILKKGIAHNLDVLFAHNATVGPTVVLHTTESKVILSTSLTAYRCNHEKIVPNYLQAYMQCAAFVQQYSSEMKQTTRNQVPITAQKKYLFMVPPLDLQNQFSDFVTKTDKSKYAVKQSLEKLETLKKALMQEYFG